MPDIRLNFDWVDAEGALGPELSATWASLEIVAGESVVTRVFDRRVKTVRDFLHVPLYPFAEWIATNWWFLSSEFQNREKESDTEFRRRHSIKSGSDGYAYPDLHIFSSGSTTRLDWRRYTPQWARVEFLNQGSLWFNSSTLQQAFADLIDAVVQRLVEHGIEDTLLQEEWSAILDSNQDEDELRFCETAAALGLDPYDLDKSKSDEIIQLAIQLGELFDEAVQVVNPKNLLEQSSVIASAVEQSRGNRLTLSTLKGLNGDFSPGLTTSDAPWRVGSECARKLRIDLGLDGQPLSTISKLAAVLEEDENLVEEATRPVQFLTKTPMVGGLIAVNDDQSTSFALRQSNNQGRRFSFCRGLSEVLAYPWSDALITDSHSERQQRNRAFAAEFLAPSFSLQRRINSQVVDDEEIDDLSQEFGVSWYVIKNQIENNQIAQLTEPIIS